FSPIPPLLTLALSYLYKMFGYKVEILKAVTWGIIVFNDLAIFAILKKLTKNQNLSVLGVFLYVLVQPFLEGNMMWFDLAIVPPILASLYFFFSERTIKNIFLIGLFLGIAAFTKQTTGVFLILTLVILFFEKVKPKQILIFL